MGRRVAVAPFLGMGGLIVLRFLVDTSQAKLAGLMQRPLVCGQLITPLTGYSNAGEAFAIDNGAFSQFDSKKFKSILQRDEQHKAKCLFVTVPDIVGNARRTLELWRCRHRFVKGWPLALVMQDGMEDFDIPWHDLQAVFIGGRDPWKDSQASQDIVKTAKNLGVHVHVGRVNAYRRWKLFSDLGADTCDGSGIAMYDHMLKAIEERIEGNERTLFDGEAASESISGGTDQRLQRPGGERLEGSSDSDDAGG
jgi:hypothetical protein